VELVDGAAQSRYANGARLQVFPFGLSPPQVAVVKGATQPIQGWVATGPNRKVPAPVIAVSYEVALPATLYTALIPSRSGQGVFQCRLLPPEASGTADAAEVRLAVTSAEWTDLLAFTGASVTVTRTDKTGAITRRFSTDPS
jgi:hypothetical protein